VKKQKKQDLGTLIGAMDEDRILTITDENGNVLGTVRAGVLGISLGQPAGDSRESFFRGLISGEMSEDEIAAAAERFGIRKDARGVVYLIEPGQTGRQESSNQRVSFIGETLRQIYSDPETATVVTLSDHAIALIRLFSGKKEAEALSEEAEAILSTINTELMETAKIAYGNTASELIQLRQSYREARVAMEIAEVFSTERRIVSYAQLGIGRLIYELPKPLCEQFLEEVFGDRRGVKLKEEEIQTVNKLFEKNLNLSETARDLYIHRNTLVYHLEKLQKKTGLDIRNFDDALTLKIALMVKQYMEYRGRADRV